MKDVEKALRDAREALLTFREHSMAWGGREENALKSIDDALAHQAEPVADWSNRRTDSHEGWVNELLTLAEHHEPIPRFARDAMKTIARGLHRVAHQAEHAEAGEAKLPDAFSDKSTANPMEKARRVLNSLAGKPDFRRYFFDDGFPRTQLLADDSKAVLAVLEALATPSPSQASEPPQQGERCKCGEKLAADCDEEWGPDCDLGNNAAHARPAPAGSAEAVDAALGITRATPPASEAPATEGKNTPRGR